MTLKDCPTRKVGNATEYDVSRPGGTAWWLPKAEAEKVLAHRAGLVPVEPEPSDE